MAGQLPHKEFRLHDYHLLVVEKNLGLYRLYVGKDGSNYCHYDTGSFRGLDDAMKAAISWFDPTVFLLFPITPYSKQEILERAPHAFESLIKERK